MKAMIASRTDVQARMEREIQDRDRNIKYLQEQRQEERNSFLAQIRDLEHDLSRAQVGRGSSTPAYEPPTRAVSFAAEASRVADYYERDFVETAPLFNGVGFNPRPSDDVRRSVNSVVNVCDRDNVSFNVNKGTAGGNRSSASCNDSIPQNNDSMLSTLVSQTNTIVQSFVNESRARQVTAADTRDLPRTQLQQFEGDPLEYWTFTKNFDDLVGNTEMKDAKKLNMLVHNCVPAVRKLIAGCQLLTATRGYNKARSVLRQKFGNPFVISQAWKAKFASYPKVTTPELLEVFAEDLTSCWTTMTEMSYTSGLESVESISVITSKLSNSLRAKWRKKHREAMSRGGIGRLEELVDIVTAAAAEATDPMYNDTRLDTVHSSHTTLSAADFLPTKKPTTVYSKTAAIKPRGIMQTQLDRELLDEDNDSQEEFDQQIVLMATEFAKKSCQFCTGNHFSSDCAEYQAKSPVERLAAVRAKRLCILCLGQNHFMPACRQKWKCQQPGCIYKHHNSLHGAFNLPKTDGQAAHYIATDTEEQSLEERDVEVNAIEFEREMLVLKTMTVKFATLPITPVMVSGPGGEFVTYALLDNGSNSTIITTRILSKLQAVTRGQAKLTVTTVIGKGEKTGTIHDFEIKGCDAELYLPVFEAVAVDELPISCQHVVSAEEAAVWRHLEEIHLPAVESHYVDILVGQDNAHLLKPGKRIDGPGLRDPFAVETPLGWTIYGFKGVRELKSDKKADVHATMVNYTASPVSLEDAVQQFWEVDRVPEAKQISAVDRGVLRYWDENLKVVDGHIQLPIPFKNKHQTFPNNRAAVVARFRALEKRLSRDDRVLQQYVTAMNLNFQKGFAEEVRGERTPGFAWWLTQFPVFHPRKPGPRPVFNGAFRYREVTLNEVVHNGPDQNNRLLDVLINFRLYPQAFTTDIKGMFNMVKVPPEQRQCMSFIWYKDGIVGNELVDCQMTTHMFGGGWSPAATTVALKRTTDLYDGPISDDVKHTIDRSFYVDDCLRSIVGVLKAIELLKGLITVLSTFQFELMKVASNSIEIVESVPEERRATGLVSLELDGGRLHVEHSLGQMWKPGPDTFCFIVEFVLDPATRREMLSTLSSLFDPMGLCAPFLIPAKRLFQQLSKRGLGWDAAVPDDVGEQWRRWVASAKEIEDLQIPRWVKLVDENEKAQLVHFSDASEAAYGHVTYICRLGEEGEIITATILMSRAKLAPKKTHSIPRLELCGAHLAVKTDRFLKEYLNLRLTKSIFWTDSSLVVRYVHSEPSQFKTFIANRVSDILLSTTSDQWYFVPGILNPSDILSRGCTASELVGYGPWINGPDFLTQGRDRWPAQPAFTETPYPEAEVKKERKIFAIDTQEKGDEAREEQEHFVEFIGNRSSYWLRVLRIVAWVIRAANRFQEHRDAKTATMKPKEEELEVEELARAEVVTVQYVQANYLTAEKADNRAFKKLFPTMRDGIIVVGGHLERATFPTEFRHPFVLPAGNYITTLFIIHCHNQVYHGGVDRTLMEARKKAWILTGRRGVRAALVKCIFCKRLKSPCLSQVMADLPSYRLKAKSRPFENVGIDYMGPVLVKIGRSEVKRWVCVIVCSVTKAVHLEVAYDLSSSGFLNAFMRFMARRGRPANVLSDNGTNFVGAKKVLAEETALWNEKHVGRFCTDRGVKWSFNPPAASHFGGFWERQIKSFRSLLYFLLKGRSLTEDLLATVVCLSEGMMNSRPMTKMSDDIEDPSPLTPNHLLIMSAIEVTSGVYRDKDLYRKTWKAAQYLADQFWERWSKQYLDQLQKRQKWLDVKANLKTGDLVLMQQDGMPRMKWPMGLITKAHAGADGLVRAADLRTETGHYTRPITKLVLLEGDLELG